MQRDHLFNRSTRPLLDSSDYHYAVQVKKKSPNEHKLHGFNDFNFVASQYKNLNNSHSGYPYSSPPPSPRLRPHDSPSIDNYMDSLGESSGDFVFSDDSGIHINNTSNFSNQSTLPVASPLSTNYYDDVISSGNNFVAPINNGKCSKNGFFKVWAGGRGDGDPVKSNGNCGPKMANKKVATVAPTPINQINTNEPFIFGVHSNSCYTFSKVNNDSVINASTIATTKYSSIDANRLRSDEVSVALLFLRHFCCLCVFRLYGGPHFIFSLSIGRSDSSSLKWRFCFSYSDDFLNSFFMSMRNKRGKALMFGS